MNISVKCFNQDEIKAFIMSNHTLGKCDVTGESDVNVVDINEVAEFFIDLLSIFSESTDGNLLVSVINRDWDIFKSDDIASTILNEICRKGNLSLNANSMVVYSDEVYLSVKKWNEIKETLKWKQRYFTGRFVDDEMRWDVYLSSNDIIDKNSWFYRGRLNTLESTCIEDKNKMGAPPALLATAGRANPQGIPFLYLTENEKTVMYETRALSGDKLSIGRFRVTKKLNILNFNKKPNLFSDYSEDLYESVADSVRGYFLREAISKDLSKPMRRYDNKEIEYVPTQFICEYVKNVTGADGIQFASSLHEGGVNLVLFDVNNAVCEKVEVKEIGKYQLEFK
jgi:hypothetical protein